MSLNSLQLDAFACVAKFKNFSLASKQLHITQSALSQRILNLEKELQTSLFVRETAGVRLTSVGERLLRCCQARSSLEEEFLGSLNSKSKQNLQGTVRVASFSTFARSVLLERIAKLTRAEAQLQVEFLTREIRQLPELLRSAQVDFIFSTEKIEKQGFINTLLGYEENVLVQSRLKNARENVYIDHDEFDTATQQFWKIQKSKPKAYERSYFDEIYAILDAVEAGLGRAVVPKHLVNTKLQVVSDLKPLKVPIYLIYFEQSFYTRLQQRLIEILAAPV